MTQDTVELVLHRIAGRRRLLLLLSSGTAIGLLAACGGAAGPTAVNSATTVHTSSVSGPVAAPTTTPASSSTARSSSAAATTTSGSASAAAATTAPALPSGKLVFWNTTEGTVSGYEQGDKNGFLDYFRSKNPNIDLEADYDSKIYTKFEQASVAGTPPDVSFVSVSSVFDYAKKGFLTDLQPYVNRSKLDMQNYYQVFFTSLRYPTPTADLYAVPYEWVNTWFTFNKDLFQHAGVPFPDTTWTYAKVRDAAAQLTDASKQQWGCTSYTGYTTPIIGCLLPSNGGQILSADYRTCTLNTPENVASIEYLHDLMYANHAAPPPGTKAPDKGWFVSGKQAISMWNCCGDLGTDRDTKGLSWDITLNPKGTKGQYNVAWSNQYVIASASKMKDAAWQLIMDALRPDRPPLTFGQGKAPIIKAAAQKWLADQKNEPPEHLGVYLDEQYLTPLQIGVSRNDWWTVFDKHVQEVMQNKVTARDAMAQAAKEIQVVLDKAWSS